MGVIGSSVVAVAAASGGMSGSHANAVCSKQMVINAQAKASKRHPTEARATLHCSG
jgi:hypothetical protein